MKQIFLSALLITSAYAFSQELDEAYLESLPESVRADLTEKIDAKDDLNKPVYRRASTFIDKDKPQSIVFGSQFFDVEQTSFMPINEPNLDSSYVLDFGDVLEIQLIGQKNLIDSYPISRDGSVNLPNVGKLTVSGLSLDDASKLIKASIKSSFIGTEAYISLKNIRDINVLVVGNAYNPGIYTINGNSNMLHVLSMAGGLNDIGSYRDISLVRRGKIIDTLDMYELLIYGKYNFSSGLRSGDSIVVNTHDKLITIESGVMRPSTYEIKDNETVYDLLKFANGLNKNYIESIIVKRITKGTTEVISLTIDEFYSFNLLSNDSIFIRESKLDTVEIIGQVINPGFYKLNRGTTLSEAINIAGGYDTYAYKFGGYLENNNALQINQNANEKLYQVFISNLIKNGLSTDQTSGIEGLIAELKNANATGRIIAEFDLDIIANNPSLDTILEDGDKLIIPKITQQVYIQGEISNTGAIRYSPGMNLDYYINKSGGVLDNADIDNIFIVHPNGETVSLKNNSRLSFINAKNEDQLIYPGSIIFIPQKSDFISPAQTASIWAPILSSIALSITSLSVLNNSN